MRPEDDTLDMVFIFSTYSLRRTIKKWLKKFNWCAYIFIFNITLCTKNKFMKKKYEKILNKERNVKIQRSNTRSVLCEF